MGFGRLTADVYTLYGPVGLYGVYTDHDRTMNQSEDIANRFISKKGETGVKSSFTFGESLQLNTFSSYKYFKHSFDEIYTASNTPNRRTSVFHELETEAVVHYDFSFDHSILAGINTKWTMMQGKDFPKPKQSVLLGMFTQYTWNMQGEDILRLITGLRFDIAPPFQKGEKMVHLNRKTIIMSLLNKITGGTD